MSKRIKNPTEILRKIAQAAKQTDGTGVNIVVAVHWQFVVTLGFDGDEIASLTEESLLAAIGAQVDESIENSGETADAIEIQELLETRSGDADKQIWPKAK